MIALALEQNNSLEVLNISLNEITPFGIQNFCTILPFTKLNTIILNKNLLGDESLISIVDCM